MVIIIQDITKQYPFRKLFVCKQLCNYWDTFLIGWPLRSEVSLKAITCCVLSPYRNRAKHVRTWCTQMDRNAAHVQYSICVCVCKSVHWPLEITAQVKLNTPQY